MVTLPRNFQGIDHSTMRERSGPFIRGCGSTCGDKFFVDEAHVNARVPKISSERRNCKHPKCFRECLTVFCSEHYPQVKLASCEEEAHETIQKLVQIHEDVSPGWRICQDVDCKQRTHRKFCDIHARRGEENPKHVNHRAQFKALLLIFDFITLNWNGGLSFDFLDGVEVPSCECLSDTCEFSTRYAFINFPETEFQPDVASLESI